MYMRYPVIFVLLAALASIAPAAPNADEAWQALPKYEFGRDLAPLLVLDGEVIRAMASPDARSACAARLAGVLESAEATVAAKKYASLQLRQVGTPAEVPILSGLLTDGELGQSARAALEQIPGGESTAALRAALDVLSGEPLVGVIDSLKVRRDAEAADSLMRLADAVDSKVASAALAALAVVGTEKASLFVEERFLACEETPTPQPLAAAAIRAADALAAAGNRAEVEKIAEKLTRTGERTPFRRAGFSLLLDAAGQSRAGLIREWLASDDADRRKTAQIAIVGLSGDEVKSLRANLAALPVDSQTALIQASVARGDKEITAVLKEAVESDDPAAARAAIEWLTMLGDKTLMGTLLDRYLEGNDDVSRAAAAALVGSNKKQVGDAMLEALASKPQRRGRVLDMLAEIRFYEAIDPLLTEAAKADPAVYEPVLQAVAKIADPDRTDLSRLIRLYLAVPDGKHRDAAARTVVQVCAKAQQGTDVSSLVIEFAPEEAAAKKADMLPLLGRLGGPKAREEVAAAISSGDAALEDAAVLALCNWPDASVADQLWNVATAKEDPARARRALRAYVRVITLPSDRGDAKTLEMLQAAMKEARHDEDRGLVLERTSTVRTIEAFRWSARHLDNPELAPSAAECVLALAHHKFLRNPNKAEFTPVLERIAQEGKTEAVRNRAKQYLLGM